MDLRKIFLPLAVLTLVLPLREGSGLSHRVTADLPTVAIRVPAHPVAQARLRAFGGPLAYNKHDPRDFGVLVCSPAIHAAAVERLAERAAALR